MTIEGWMLFVIVAVVVLVIGGGALFFSRELFPCSTKLKLLLIRLAITAVGAAIVFGTFSGLKWYFTQTAEGRRAVVDQRSNMNNGLERTINILNADGEVIRTYTGVIDIEGNDGGYVVFDYNGQRYTYYNCYLESIANIEQ